MAHHAPAMCMLLLLLPDELLWKILCLVLEDGIAIQVFQRICDDPVVMRRMSLRVLHDYAWSDGEYVYRNEYLYSRFEKRFRRAAHPESLCYDGMDILMTQPLQSAKGLDLADQAAQAGNSVATYFMAMLLYRSNPADPRALAVLQGISGGPSLPGGRWENRNMEDIRNKVRRDLKFIVKRHYFSYCYDPPLLLIQDPHVCAWAECRRYGNDGWPIIRYCSSECRIRHEFDLWTRYLDDRVTRAISRIRM